MKLYKDAFGHEVWDFYKGIKTSEIIERDDGYVDLSVDTAYYFSEYKSWTSAVKKSLKYVRGRVLDIGCGVGRHSLYLQKNGFDVTGIDNSPLAIKVCKNRGLKKAKIMSISDIGKFKIGSFDTIIMMGNNFGLMGNFRKAKLLLREMHAITSKGAMIIAEFLDPYNTDDPYHKSYHKLNKKRGRMGGQVRMRVLYKRYKSEWFDYLLVSEKEMRMILHGTGWAIRKIIKNDKPYVALIEKVE